MLWDSNSALKNKIDALERGVYAHVNTLLKRQGTFGGTHTTLRTHFDALKDVTSKHTHKVELEEHLKLSITFCINHLRLAFLFFLLFSINE